MYTVHTRLCLDRKSTPETPIMEPSSAMCVYAEDQLGFEIEPCVNSAEITLVDLSRHRPLCSK